MPSGVKPKIVTRKLAAVLDPRAQDVIMSRFGLGDGSVKTLESIGQRYGITRERVRQIENVALRMLRGSDVYSAHAHVFDAIKYELDRIGGLAPEGEFLNTLSRAEDERNHYYFLLVLGDEFYKIKEDDHCTHIWCMDIGKAENVRNAMKMLHNRVKTDDLFSERDIVLNLKAELKSQSTDIKDDLVRLWLNISKIIGKNIFGEWGHVSSPNISPKGMRDYAFLVLRRQGSPMHFREVAGQINEIFGREAHSETVHNELIKDSRFVLVGRGLYALTEWGYSPGVVRDVIASIIRENGPLAKSDIIKRVLKERYVKENTIMVNLQNKKYFTRNKDKRYTLVV